MTSIAWCDSPLEEHLVRTAVIAATAYSVEWVSVARRHGLPLGLLPAAALAHDIGKALPCFQDAATRACSQSRDPSFRNHEYVSAIAILATIPRAEALRGGGLVHRVLSLAALLHHHGMGRLEEPSKWTGLRLGGKCGSLRNLGREQLAAAVEAYNEAAGRYNRLAGKAGLPLAEPSRLEAPRLDAKMLFSHACALRPDKIYQQQIIQREPGMAAGMLLSGMVAVADSLAASLERSGEPHGYAARVLEEKRLLDRVLRVLGQLGL